MRVEARLVTSLSSTTDLSPMGATTELSIRDTAARARPRPRTAGTSQWLNSPAG